MAHLGDPDGLELVAARDGGQPVGGEVAMLGEELDILRQVELAQPVLQPALTHGRDGTPSVSLSLALGDRWRRVWETEAAYTVLASVEAGKKKKKKDTLSTSLN